MNASQRQYILDEIERFKKTDFFAPFKEKYGAEETVETLVFLDYSVSELFALANRAVEQLECVLNSNIWQALPSDNIQTAYGQVTLYDNLAKITDYLQNTNYTEAARCIKAQINFQMMYGLWEKPKQQGLKIRESSLERLEYRVELSNSLIDAKVEYVNSLISDLENRKLQIENLITTKKNELEFLKSNQTESNTILENIKNAQHNAITSQDTIESLNGKANNIVTALKSAFDKAQEQIDFNNAVVSQLKKALDDFNTEAEYKISKITSDFDSVSDNAEEVRKMMGYIADGTLSHSFNKRKEDLSKQTRRWFLTSVITAFCAIGWVCVVFLWLGADTKSEWANILINGIKSSPLFFLLGFAISQYQKERNLMEEYAFRESVAVTLTAYLEQMPEKEDDEKRKLLISTVEQLYTKPVIANKEYGLLKFDSKDLSETSKTLKELVETLLKKK